MAWDVIKFLKDYRISMRQHTGDWVNICCPFRHNHKGGDLHYFGGFDLATGAYNCWSCKSVSSAKVIAELLRINMGEAISLLQGYGGSDRTKFIKTKRENTKEMIIPGKPVPREPHIKYLEGRGYNHEILIEKYNLQFTTGLDLGWEHRIVLPITYDNQVVSYQARDITNKAFLRYRSATPEESLVHYKDVIFGLDNWPGAVCGIVEGAYDVFRMGKGIGTGFGSALTAAQINLLANRFEKVIFLFDPSDENAWKKSKEHVAELRSMGINSETIKWEPALDPDDLGFVDCRKLKHECGIR